MLREGKYTARYAVPSLKGWLMSTADIDLLALLGGRGAKTMDFSLPMAAFAPHPRNHPMLCISNLNPLAARELLVLLPGSPCLTPACS